MEYMLKDSFNRKIDYLRVSVTDKCNLSCMYCMPNGRVHNFDDTELLTAQEIARFIRTARIHGVTKVRITGGEPLLRQDILEIIQYVKSTGIRNLSITTNGVLLKDMAVSLKKAGLDRVNISLDTLKPDRYGLMTRGGDITRVWEAIESAERAGIWPVKINVVQIRGINDDETIEFARLTMEKDWHIRFIELMPVGRSVKWSREACVTKDELIAKISNSGKLKLLKFKGKGPSRNYRLEGAKGIIGFISPISDCFCEWCNRLRLTAHGRIKPCLFSDEVIDIITPMRNGVSDDEIENLFKRAVCSKPAGHGLSEHGYSGLSDMSKIGG